MSLVRLAKLGLLRTVENQPPVRSRQRKVKRKRDEPPVPPIVNPPVDGPIVELDKGYEESIRKMYGLPPIEEP